jgi:phenylalanyl-tRNA synthetase beta chain
VETFFSRHGGSYSKSLTEALLRVKLLSKLKFWFVNGAQVMKISLNWLSDYIKTGLCAEEIADILSDLGLPCEGIEHLADDSVIDVEVTSNRGDCLSHIGIGRELAAATGKKLTMPAIELEESTKKVGKFVKVEILAPDLCWRYTARVIESVKVGPSPDWMKKRLEAVGLRSVNNVVDATNYAMMETGQPPHAFDYAKITDGKIIVRKAAIGERIISIDGSKCDLATDMLIIADSGRPVAIAGVMGGGDTETSERTTSILLEDAYFDPVSVRTTSGKLALPTEASFRFERTVDVEMIDWASRRAAQLIMQVAGGKAAKGVIDVYPNKPATKEVRLRLSRLNALLGIEIPVKEVVKILSRLGFAPQQKGDGIVCTVPSWRSEIYREADLIEEVARVHGYNKIPTERKIEIEVVPVGAREKMTKLIGGCLNSCGFYETVNVGFIDDSIAALFGGLEVGEHLSVKEESGKSAKLLRRTLLGSLFGVLKTNLNAKNTPCKIFEIADTFVKACEKDTLPIEKTKLAMVCDSDFRELRGAVESVVKSIDRNAEIIFKHGVLSWAQVGAEILVSGKKIGVAGIAGRAIEEKFDFKTVTPCAAELDLEALMSLAGEGVRVRPIPRFPAIERDLSIIIGEEVCWADIEKAVNEKASDKLEEVRFVGVYMGKGIEPAQKSVTLSLRFRDEDGTLTHEAVDGFESSIVERLNKSVGAELRTV